MSEENVETQDIETPPDVLNMSDEEFEKIDLSSYEEESQSEDNTNVDDQYENVSEDTNIDTTSDISENQEQEIIEDGEQSTEETNIDESSKTDDDNTATDENLLQSKETTGESDNQDDSQKKDMQSESEVDLQAFYNTVMGEFKANGRMMKVKSAEDIITLMQMGANYHQKMKALNPSLKTLKLLEKHDLLDPDKINNLIDLQEKNPEAITQLLKDSKIDPMDIDLEAENNYTPKQRTVSDTEIQLDRVLDEIQHSPSYNRTLNVLGSEWDDQSRAIISQNPDIIKAINEHIESGIYDQVANAVAYERSLGKLAGLNDFQAYKQMGDYMDANNLFKATDTNTNQVNPQTTQQQSQIVDTQPVIEQQSTSQGTINTERQQRKAAASPTRSTKTPTKKSDYNPLAMSDEEFLKINNLDI